MSRLGIKVVKAHCENLSWLGQLQVTRVLETAIFAPKTHIVPSPLNGRFRLTYEINFFFGYRWKQIKILPS